MAMDMDGVRIQQKDSTTYVGLTMTAAGLDMTASTTKRFSDAKKTLFGMKGKGFNGFGFRNLHTHRRRTPATAEIPEYVSPHFMLSPHAYFYRLPPSHIVSSNLNASYFYRLHQSNDLRNITLHTYCQGLECDHCPQSTSLIQHTLKYNPHFNSLQQMPILLNLLLVKNDMPMLIPSNTSLHKLPADKIDEWHYKDLFELQNKSTACASKILPLLSAKCDTRLSWPARQVRDLSPELSRCGSSARYATTKTARNTGIRRPPPDFTALEATITDEAISKLEYKGWHQDKIEAVHSAFSEILDASSVTLQQELDAIFSEYKGPRSIRAQAERIMSASCNPANFNPTHRSTRGHSSAPAHARGRRPPNGESSRVRSQDQSSSWRRKEEEA
ncbi:hypothetical protein HDU80_008578 [Chytriomyces hyalinus]|nr:hypothetical protein HDU80_008578 [Chytriomyces hyalinus]